MAQEEIDQVTAAGTLATMSPSLVGEDDSVDLIELFHKLRRGRKTILAVTLTCCLLATGFAFLLPFRYTSTTSFIPPASVGGESSMAFLAAGQLSAMGAGNLLGSIKNPGDLYAGILRSHAIASELVKRFDLMNVFRVKKESQAEKILASSTDIIVDMRSSIVTVDVTAKSPEMAHDLAKGYMDALRDTNGRLALGQSSQRRLFFGQQLEKEKDDLAGAEVELKKTEEQSGLIAPNGQTEEEIKIFADTQAQIAVRQVELAALRESATEQNPDVVRLRSEIDDLQGQLSRLQRGKSNTSITEIPTSNVPEIQLEYVRRERDVKYHEALFDMLSRQYEAARLDEARDAPVLQVLDEANYPDTKSSPKRSYYAAGGLVFGFIAGATWVLIRPRIRALRPSLAPVDAT
jgi:uncharacterized protein involved in exopolysaccharide biosynthesis